MLSEQQLVLLTYKRIRKETEAVALGTPSEETQYALDYFNIEAPRVVTEAASETNQVMLVDHNEFQQSISDIAEVNILAVVDHHRIANFETADPLYYRAEPVGCTSTIIYKMFKENNVTIPAQIAGMMVSAIISIHYYLNHQLAHKKTSMQRTP